MRPKMDEKLIESKEQQKNRSGIGMLWDNLLLDVEGYCNSDYASGKDNRKSITGIVIYLCEAQVCWKSKGQKAVAFSTTESKYYATSDLCSELILYIMQILEF